VAGVDEEYVERVLSLVAQVPAGRVTTYGALAAAVGSAGPRQVGTVMSRHGDLVPWWRVVHADGTLAPHKPADQAARLRREGVPVTGNRCTIPPDQP
jgi:alkylated DNA nucleotide flippase Atl1